jgi:hypothetical protein
MIASSGSKPLNVDRLRNRAKSHQTFAKVADDSGFPADVDEARPDQPHELIASWIRPYWI